MAHMKVVAFQGNPKSNGQPAPPMTLQPVKNLDLTPSPDVPLAILKRKMMVSNDIRVARGLLMEINTHLKVKIHKVICCFGCRSVLHVPGPLWMIFKASHANQIYREDLTAQTEHLPFTVLMLQISVCEHICVCVCSGQGDDC